MQPSWGVPYRVPHQAERPDATLNFRVDSDNRLVECAMRSSARGTRTDSASYSLCSLDGPILMSKNHQSPLILAATAHSEDCRIRKSQVPQS